MPDTAVEAKASAASNWIALDDFTASVPIRLLTPRAARLALQLLGLEWEPEYRDGEIEEPERIVGSGLYAWVAGTNSDPLARGVLYWGIGRGAGGVDGRLDYEYSTAHPAYDHGHGMAIGRSNARAVRSPVRTSFTAAEVQQRGALLGLNELSTRGRQQVIAFLRHLVVDGDDGPIIDLALVEWFVIRLSIQVGHTGAPVQSQHATAWANTSEADWAAYAVRCVWEGGAH